MKEETVTFPAGTASLTGTFFAPDSPTNGAVLISAATGIPHGYYQHFARWLATEHGLAVLSYDYRDFGASLHGPMKASKATMAIWAVDDVQAARSYLLSRVPEGDLWMIGHSLGGLGHRFHAPEPRLKRAIAVTSGPAYQSEHPMPYRLFVLSFWHVLGPLFTTVMGYLPGKKTGLGADIPSGVFWQWRRWCTTRGFCDNDPDKRLANPQSLTCELRTVSLSDDEMIPPHVVRQQGDWHPDAKQTHVVLSPAEFGLGEVGHLAAFRRKNAALWPEIIQR
ncbi:alpha/beta hydrolase [Lentibacter algarum]|uniref:alpha/beta hydrolase family protein n=1 Tax=Lentibacter algarum TaxID=576131 RepID=UPI001C08D699|nr:alpha/beta fold hydrolase [Lentibacter algarum]MBU2983562.1 alpha/beta hydrolase [Lentibacter algarum]